MLRTVRLGAREHPAPAGVLAPRHPGLLAAQDEVVVVLDRARAQRREVGPGLGLREALAPDLLGRQDRRDVAPPLLVVAEAQQRRPEDVEPDDVDELRRAGRGELLVDDDLLDRRAPAAAELARPCAADVAGLVARGLPAAQDLHPLVERAREVGGIEPLACQERPDLGLQRPLLVCRSQSHRTEIVSVYQRSHGYRLACNLRSEQLN